MVLRAFMHPSIDSVLESSDHRSSGSSLNILQQNRPRVISRGERSGARGEEDGQLSTPCSSRIHCLTRAAGPASSAAGPSSPAVRAGAARGAPCVPRPSAARGDPAAGGPFRVRPRAVSAPRGDEGAPAGVRINSSAPAPIELPTMSEPNDLSRSFRAASSIRGSSSVPPIGNSNRALFSRAASTGRSARGGLIRNLATRSRRLSKSTEPSSATVPTGPSGTSKPRV